MTKKLLAGLFAFVLGFGGATLAQANKLEIREADNSFDGYIDDSNVWQGVTLNGNAATATEFASDPNNCSAGQVAGGVTAAGVAESCLDPITETELSSLAELNTQISANVADGAHTTDTSADTICSGTGNYLDGEGNCDALVTGHGDGADCGDGFYALGVDASGAAVCSAVNDTAGGVDASTAAVTANVMYDHEQSASIHHTATTDTGPSPDCSGTTTYQDGDGGCDDISSVYQAADADLDDLADGSLTATKLDILQLVDTTANICGATPADAIKWAYSTDAFDIYTATGTGIGDWRNSRTGTGPC